MSTRLNANYKVYFLYHMKLQAKLLIVYLFVGVIAGVLSAFGFWTMRAMIRTFGDVTGGQVPRMFSIQESLVALSQAQAAADGALDITSIAHIDEVSSYEATLRGAMLKFDMYLAALTWGSESEAFHRSAGGINSREWDRSGLRGKLIVLAVDPQQAQNIKTADMHFTEFANAIQTSVASYKRALRLADDGKGGESQLAFADAHEAQDIAQGHANLAVEALQAVVAVSNEHIRQDTVSIVALQKIQQERFIVISGIGTVLALFTFMLFISKVVVRPLEDLKRIADAFSTGDFTKRASNKKGKGKDEIEALGVSFNSMADKLVESKQSLEATVAARTHELSEKVEELEKNKHAHGA